MAAPLLQRELTPRQSALRLTEKQVSLPWAIYVRVSTKDQLEKYSPAAQLDILRRFVDDLGVNVPEQYVFIDGKSGRTDDRAGYQRILQLADDRAIGGAVAICVDRVARDVVGAIDARRQLKRGGAALLFAEQTFDDTAQGTLMYSQFAAFAAFEADLFKARSAKGRTRKAKERKPGSELRAYGYVYHRIEKKDRKYSAPYYTVHPEQASTVLWIFERYAECKSLLRVAKELNQKRIPTMKERLWATPTLALLLRNTMYVGHTTVTIKDEFGEPHTYEVEFPAIVPQALFDKVQVILASAAKRRGRRSNKYLLSGKLWCLAILADGKVCDHRWNAQWKGFYACSHIHHATKERFCRAYKRLRSRDFDQLIFDRLRAAIRNPEQIHRMAVKEAAATAKGQPRTESIATRRGRLQNAYDSAEATLFGNVPERTRAKAEARLREIEQQMLALDVEERESATVKLPALSAVEESFALIAEGLDALETFEEKRGFIEHTVDRVETDGREYTIRCKIQLAAKEGHGRNSKLADHAIYYFAFNLTGKVAA